MLKHYEVSTSKRRKKNHTEAKGKDRRNQFILFRQYSKFNKFHHANNYATRKKIYTYIHTEYNKHFNNKQMTVRLSRYFQ